MRRLNIADQHKHYAAAAFLWALLLAAAVIAPIMIYDHGYFLYYGDFNVQEIPFYRLAHDTIRSGNVGWSHLTDLGANFIGSYSFYLLGSPFFYLTLLLPSAWVAYAMGPLLALKLACASLTAYIYLRRYVRNKQYAVIGGLLYAFSGFSLYNIFFFHFHEAMIVFPLLLAAMDSYHYERRRGVTATAVFACAVTNYYFFFGQVVFAALYYIIKMITKSYRFRLTSFLRLAVECVIGLCCAMFLMLPSLAAITGNYRVSEITNGWTALLYTRTQRYLQILISLFFPGDIPAKPNFTPDAGGKWSSVAAYLPMFSTVYVISYLRSHKRSFLRIFLTVLFIMALVPGLNSLFQALNSTYYARWYYMLTLILALTTIKALDQTSEHPFKKGFIPTAIITVAVTLVIGLMPYEAFKSSVKTVYKLGIEAHPTSFWLFAGIAIAGLALTLCLHLIRIKKPRYLTRCTALLLSLFLIGYSSVYLWLGKRHTDDPDSFMIKYALNGGADLTLPDVKEVRSDFYGACDNLGMYWQIPTIQAFHSIVPASVMEFYNRSGIQRDVGSRPSTEYYGLRALLSVKYLFVPFDESFADQKGNDLMPGYRYIRAENGCDLYENTCYIPMGFTYDTFISEEEYLDSSDKVQHLALLKAMVLSQYQMKKYADITGYSDGMYLDLNAQFDENHTQDAKYPTYLGFESKTGKFVYTTEAYLQDVEQRRKSACSSFAYTNDGFTATFENKGDDNLLFFSVPYDDGWRAYIDGEEAEVEKVNIGFMAVKVQGHHTSEITFRYTTPFLKEGVIISGGGFTALILYLIISGGFRATRRPRKRYRIKQKSIQLQGGTQ